MTSAPVAGMNRSIWARASEYEISDLGRSLAPLFASLARWSDAHLDQVEQARRQYDALGRLGSS